MKMDENGIAAFVIPNVDGKRLSRHLATSPINKHILKSKASKKTSFISQPKTELPFKVNYSIY